MIKTVVAFLIVIMLLSAAFMVHSPSSQKNRAKVSLNTYLSDIGLTSIKSTCNKDSDGDGYASCSYNNGAKIVNLECDSAFVFNTNSCKAPKNMFN